MPPADGPGTQIGPYKLIDQIGEGGFGVVFRAEQQQPIRRTVALKTIKPGMDTRQVVGRFETERQALALMEHPHIARVLDGGVTGSGSPYFVMELVQGIPITQYCDEHRLTPQERLALFVAVCQAVQHAHQKGIIHRDLKPSNVLVAEQDGVPVPKVIDFGVAKALGQPLSEQTLATGLGRIIGTLEYMSPEQAEFNASDVDTRADIYSLGVLLYELLTGTTPLTKDRLRQAAVTELLRVIREEDPPRPSTRLTDSKDMLASVSAQRKLEPARLTRTIRGELDWIVMKALDKNRNRRYETARDFGLDLERYLSNEPVLAGPPSAAYRLRKTVRRHWRILAGVSSFMVLLVAAVIALSVALMAVDRERRAKEVALEAESRRRSQARTALDAMTSQIIEDRLTRNNEVLPGDKQFLEQALRYYEEFAADTGQDKEVRTAVADAYLRVCKIRRRLGDEAQAEIAAKRAYDLYAGLANEFHGVPDYRRDLARLHLELSAIYRKTGRLQAARAEGEQALTIARDLATTYPDDPKYRQNLAMMLDRHAIMLKNTGRFREAEDAYREALTMQKELSVKYPDRSHYRDELAQTQLNLGVLLTLAGRSDAAIETLTESGKTYESLFAESPGDAHIRESLAASRDNLGNVLRDAGRNDEAEKVFRETLIVQRALVNDFPAVPDYQRGLAVMLNNLGILLKNTDRFEEAEQLYRQAATIHQQLAAAFPAISDHQNEAAGAMVNLARLLLIRANFAAARNVLVEAAPYHQAALKANPTHPDYRKFYRLNRWRLAEALLQMREHAAAAEVVEQFLEAAVEPGRDAYTAAQLLAGCVRLADEDDRFSESEREELAKSYGDRALAALRLAIERQAEQIAQIKTDSALDPLRSRQEFQDELIQLDRKQE